MALSEDFFLPSSVRGPVECCAFSLLVMYCAAVAIFVAPSVSTEHTKGRLAARKSGKLLRRQVKEKMRNA